MSPAALTSALPLVFVSALSSLWRGSSFSDEELCHVLCFKGVSTGWVAVTPPRKRAQTERLCAALARIRSERLFKVGVAL